LTSRTKYFRLTLIHLWNHPRPDISLQVEGNISKDVSRSGFHDEEVEDARNICAAPAPQYDDETLPRWYYQAQDLCAS
jgi:hypothetical protein